MSTAAPLVDRNAWLVVPEELARFVPDYFDSLDVDGLTLARCSDGRFMEDRCLTVTEEYALLVDGVILNKVELFAKTGKDSVPELVGELVHTLGIQQALACLRGPFSGAVLDRRKRVLYAFANQTGESAAFSYSWPVGPLLSNGFDLMMRIARAANLPVTFDEHAALVMLTYGFMIDDHSFAREVTRIGPGAFASFDLDEGHSVKERYWSLSAGEMCDIRTIDEAVVELDRLFRRAVERCFNKDLEYGYARHLVDLSGGLDARMVNVVARDLGFGAITNISYSESQSDEHRYTIRLAAQLGNDCLYHPMDGGRSVLSPEENLRLNSGLAFYSGITGGHFVLRSLNVQEFGLEHTGQIGGAVVGTYLTGAARRPPTAGAGAYSHVNNYPAELEEDDAEIFFMNTRAFRGSTSTHVLRQHFTYAVSPYSDVELLQFAFSLPLEWRLKHKLFARWVKNCYPSALAVPTTRFLPLKSSYLRNVALFVRKAVGVLSRRAQGWLQAKRLHSPRFLARLGYSMNPLESWYANNSDFRSVIDDSREAARSIDASPELAASLDRSFGPKGSMWDKVLGVTVVTMYSMYFGPKSGAAR